MAPLDRVDRTDHRDTQRSRGQTADPIRVRQVSVDDVRVHRRDVAAHSLHDSQSRPPDHVEVVRCDTSLAQWRRGGIPIALGQTRDRKVDSGQRRRDGELAEQHLRTAHGEVVNQRQHVALRLHCRRAAS